jgi:site-specific recombinase XerD
VPPILAPADESAGHDIRAIQAYLGHRSIMSTVRCTALTPNRFKHFWKD